MNSTNPPSRLAVVMAFAAVYIIWGSTYLAIRFGIETLPPFMLGAIRFAVAGVVLYGYARWRGAPAPTRTQWMQTAWIGTLMLCGGNGLVCWAESHVPSGTAALLIALVPVFMVLLDVAWVRRSRLNLMTVIGITCGFAGVALLVTGNGASGERIHGWGALALVGASLSWSIGSLHSRECDLPSSPTLTTAMEMIGGSIALALVGGGLGEWGEIDPQHVSASSILSLVYLILFGSIVALTAYVWLLRNVSAASVSTYAFVNPVVALFLGWLFANETIHSTTIVAGGAIIVGVIMIHRARHGRALEVREPAVPCDASPPTESVLSRSK